jgi:hypothetical protein
VGKGQIQHPLHVIKSASKSDHCFYKFDIHVPIKICVRIHVGLTHLLVCRKSVAVLWMRPEKPRPRLSHQVWNDKDPSLLLSAEHRPKVCSPSPATSRFKWKILERNVKQLIEHYTVIYIAFKWPKKSQVEKVGQMQIPEYALKSVSLVSLRCKFRLKYLLFTHCLLSTKIGQAEKDGHMQHPEYALKSASTAEPVV